MKILYAGSPLASALVLRNLIEFCISEEGKSSGIEIAGVLTNPPSARGRSKEPVQTEVAAAARINNIPVFEFDHLLEEARTAVSALGADVLVSFNFGRIFGPKFLSLFPLGGINLHPSALPKHRGCTPVPAAILAGESELGITVQKLALKTDEGDILEQSFIPLDGTETAQSLLDGDGTKSPVVDEGSALLIKALKKYAAGNTEGKKQEGEGDYTPFIKKEDGLIDWSETALTVSRKIRAFTPWPSCFTGFNGVKLSVLKALPSSDNTSEKAGTVLPYRKNIGIEIACGDGSVLVVKELQLQGKKAMDYKSFLNGARDFIGSVLDDKIN
jgi:methionyl-tRNA formyltransferase